MSVTGAHKLIFGSAAIGMAYGLPRPEAATAAGLTLAEVEHVVESALDAGITTFDTAPVYGEAESRLGQALRGRGRIWTKVASGDPGESLDASLTRLRRDHVDAMQWHNWTASLADDLEWRRAWERLRQRSDVRELGATTYGRADALAAVASGLFDLVQVEYNVLNQGVVEAIASSSHAARVRVAVRSVYLQGALTTEGRKLPPLETLVRGVAKARAASHGGNLTALALRAALQHPSIAHVLIGIDRTEQIDEAMTIARTVDPQLTNDRLRELDLDGDPAADPRTWPR